MEYLHFQVNDKVYDLMLGNGIIKGIDCGEIIVHFDLFTNEEEVFFDLQGILKNIEWDTIGNELNKRTLYHGHDLEVTIKEKKPERFKWVNIYEASGDINNGRESFNTKGEALKNIKYETNKDIQPMTGMFGFYIDTIQLKHKENK